MTPHGVPGQLNVYTLDVDSSVTSYGQHNRLVVFRGVDDESDIITVREDISDLPMSTEADRLRVARHPRHRLHPPLTLLEPIGSVAYQGRLGESIEHTYKILWTVMARVT